MKGVVAPQHASIPTDTSLQSIYSPNLCVFLNEASYGFQLFRMPVVYKTQTNNKNN